MVAQSATSFSACVHRRGSSRGSDSDAAAVSHRVHCRRAKYGGRGPTDRLERRPAAPRRVAEHGELHYAFWRHLIVSLILTPGLSSQRTPCQDFGLETGFERRLNAAVPPGSSAVFMIVPRRTLARLTDELNRLQGTLIDSPIHAQPVRLRARYQATIPGAPGHGLAAKPARPGATDFSVAEPRASARLTLISWTGRRMRS